MAKLPRLKAHPKWVVKSAVAREVLYKPVDPKLFSVRVIDATRGTFEIRALRRKVPPGHYVILIESGGMVISNINVTIG